MELIEIEMNDKRRNKIAKAASILEAVLNMVETIHDEEQDCLYNMPENLEYSERYEKMENAVEKLDDAISSIEEAKDALEEAAE